MNLYNQYYPIFIIIIIFSKIRNATSINFIAAVIATLVEVLFYDYLLKTLNLECFLSFYSYCYYYLNKLFISYYFEDCLIINKVTNQDSLITNYLSSFSLFKSCFRLKDISNYLIMFKFVEITKFVVGIVKIILIITVIVTIVVTIMKN